MFWLYLFLSIRDSDCQKLLLHVQVSRGLDLGPQLGPTEAKKGTSMDYMQETEQYFSLNFKMFFFFFWHEVLSPWCALWCLNKFDMLSFQGLSFLHTWLFPVLFQLISLFPIWKMPNKFLRGCDLKYSSSAHLLHFISQGKWFHRSRHEQTLLSNGCLNGL